MRFFATLLLVTAMIPAAFAQSPQTAETSGIGVSQSNSFVTSTKTPTGDAPVFPTPAYFVKVFGRKTGRVELKSPVRLSDFVVGKQLELSLRNYIELVLANNTDIEIQRVSVEAFRNDILRQHFIFDPTLLTSFNTTRAQQPASDILAGALVPNTLRQPFSLRAQQLLPTGTSWNFGFDTVKFSTNSQNATFNPSINSVMTFGFTQPLLRNRGMYLTKLPVTIARSRTRQGDFQVQDQILRLVGQAELSYWNVIFARENLRVQEQNLSVNRQSLERAQRELELGAISQLEIFQPQAQYANAEILVTQARYNLQQTEDQLRRQIAVDLDPTMRELPIVLTEDVAQPVQITLERPVLVDRALRQRPDLLSFRQQLDVDDLFIQQTNNFLKPDFRLTGSYASSGLGGNFYPRPNSGGQPPITVPPSGFIAGGIGDAFGQVFGFDYPTYSLGLQLNFPLRDRRASADYADALVNKRLDSLRVRTLEQQTRLEVLNNITSVENSRASVELAKVQLDFAQKRLEGDQKRYDLGTITLFFLLNAQADLNRAQSDLVNNTVNYRRAITNLLRSTADLLTERGVRVN